MFPFLTLYFTSFLCIFQTLALILTNRGDRVGVGKKDGNNKYISNATLIVLPLVVLKQVPIKETTLKVEIIIKH